MKRILTVLIITTSSLFGEVRCDTIEPKFDSIEIRAEDIITALEKLESEAQDIYAQFKMSPVLNVFHLTDRRKKKIEYEGKALSVLQVASGLLKKNEQEFYISDTETIWIGATEKRINAIESRYPAHLKDIRIPQVNISDASITDVEKAVASLWSSYSQDETTWQIEKFLKFDEKINIQMRGIDVMSLVVYLDLLHENGANRSRDGNFE